ncbi:thioredoxin-like protein [Dipodascopsis uninucleata]
MKTGITSSVTVLLYILILLSSGTDALFYGKDTSVINLYPSSFEREVFLTNYTTIVEFYAEWCGHCKNLRPHYAKAAKSLNGVAKVAAVRCDDDINQPLCNKYGVRGYPTIKIFKPNSATPKKPYIEDYQGARTAKAIVDTVLGKISNQVSRIRSDNFDSWMDENGKPKVILFSNKPNVPPLFKALALDYTGSISFAMVRNTEIELVSRYGITKFPTIIVATKSDDGSLTTNVYEGEQKKNKIYDYLIKNC